MLRSSGMTLLLIFLGATSARAGHVFHTHKGSVAHDLLGSSVGDAGDVDGDGISDIIVGAPGNGYARVYSGRDGEIIHEWNLGDNRHGIAVDGAGDVDGDGYADLIVSGIGVFIYSGRTGALRHHFPDEGFELGLDVAGVGDIDRDGFDDVMFGGHTGNGRIHQFGKAEIRSGLTGNIIHSWVGHQYQGKFGYALSGAGDIDLDGWLDVIVSEPRFSINGIIYGKVFCYSGRTGGEIRSRVGTGSNADPNWDWFGLSLAGGEDFNGDGVPDIVIGDPYHNGLRGMAWICSGANFYQTLYARNGINPGDFYGRAVANTLDVDQDGVGEIVIGSPGSDASDYQGVVVLLSGGTGNQIVRFRGPQGNDFPSFGGAVCGAGDVNQDGYGDFCIGAGWNDGNNGLSNAGEAFLYSGQDIDWESWNYGTGWPGTHGVPVIESTDPVLCEPWTLSIGNSYRQPTPGILFIALNQGSFPTGLGGTILVAQPWLLLPIQLPPSRLELSFTMTCDTALAGESVFFQALIQDPGASRGYAFTRGLQIIRGLD